MCNADRTVKNTEKTQDGDSSSNLLYKKLLHFSSFQFPSQYLRNLMFFVHSAEGIHCKLCMQTIEEGKAWMQLWCLLHKPFIFWWNLMPVTDLSISCVSLT